MKKDGLYGYIDKTGKEVIKRQFDYAATFLEEGLAMIKLNKKIGFIDRSGKIIVSPQYDDYGYGFFSEGLIQVKKNGSYGFIDPTGKEVIPTIYHETSSKMIDGVIVVVSSNIYNKREKYIMKNPLDVPTDWARNEVQLSIDNNLVPASMQFGYMNNINRLDFSKLIMRLLEESTGKTTQQLLTEKKLKVDTTIFDDTLDRDILSAYALGIIGGKAKGVFDPYGEITRQEAAVILTRAAKFLGIPSHARKLSFTDTAKIASWAKDAVAYITTVEDKTNNNFVMQSTGSNQFSPNATYTTQQAFITMNRLYHAAVK